MQAAAHERDLLAPFATYLSNKRAVPANDIEQCFETVGGRIVLFLDAINESFEAQELAACIEGLSAGNGNIKCLVTATPLFHYFAEHLRVDMRAAAIAPDIESYVKREIGKFSVMGAVPQAKILDALVPRAGGMIRWVDCQTRELATQRTPRLVLKALAELPGNLDKTYAAILLGVPNADRDFVREALLWLCFSLRPLTLDELCEAVVLQEGDRTIDDSCRLVPPQQLVKLCRGLVVINESSQTVTLAHSSTRNFLTGEDIKRSACSSFALDAYDSQRSMVRMFLTYLTIVDFTHWSRDSREVYDWFHEYPLLDYASQNWCAHARRCQDWLTEADLCLVDDFTATHRIQGAKSAFTFWARCLLEIDPGIEEVESEAGNGGVLPDETLTTHASLFSADSVSSDELDFEAEWHDANRRVLDAAEPLYYMASASFEVYVERMFSRRMVGKQPDMPWFIDHKYGRNFSTALQVACFRG